MEESIRIEIKYEAPGEYCPTLVMATIRSNKEDENAVYDRSAYICSDSYYRTVEFNKDDMPKLLRYIADFGASHLDVDIDGIVSVISDERDHS